MLPALLLTLLAGSATSIGAAIALLGRAGSDRFLAAGLGFSAGVMLCVSFAELLPQGARVLAGAVPDEPAVVRGRILAALAFAGGMALVLLLRRLIPASPPPEPPGPAARGGSTAAPGRSEEARLRSRLLRTGMLTAAVLALHNLPEGLATFVSALQSPEIAIPIVVAIAIHNIPEGIAVALPIHRATGSRSRAFWIATLSGIAEPVGAVIGFLLLAPWIEGAGMGAVLAAIAGVMVLVSLIELLPSALERGRKRVVALALLGGAAVMATSLLLLG